MEQIKTDCRHLRWDRPCDPHKREGVHCADCSHYDPVGERVLIVKLDALGDVLRTTCILKPLRDRRPRAQVTWLTMPEAMPLLLHNPFVDRAVAYGPDALAMLAAERFDLVLCLDAAPRSAALGAAAHADEKRGFGLDERGQVVPFTPEAEEWLVMGLFDDVKRRNRRTYNEIVMGIAGLPGPPGEIVVLLDGREREFARAFAGRVGLPQGETKERSGVRLIGVNTGSGSRWPMKQWDRDRCTKFIRAVAADEGARVLLFGGMGETARNRAILRSVGGALVDTGCDNSLREFMALVDLCDIFVTSDTLGLHVALGLGKKVVGLFGPTSAAEIDMYGRGVKIVPNLDCACCYLRECPRTPSCMELIAPEDVREALQRLLAG